MRVAISAPRHAHRTEPHGPGPAENLIDLGCGEPASLQLDHDDDRGRHMLVDDARGLGFALGQAGLRRALGDGHEAPVLAEGTFPAGSVTAEKISDVIAERKAIAHKILAVSDGDVQLYVATTGDDTTGDGSIGNPFATRQRAWDSLLAIINHKYVINIADGVYSTSSRRSASMQRPALIHCDQKKMGLRSAAPGGVLTAAVVFMGESKAGVILQPGSANGYTTGVYQRASLVSKISPLIAAGNPRWQLGGCVYRCDRHYHYIPGRPS